ncbi:hypothetical protein BDF19DRAFT_97707 [Syncephalis fuscata]|nr:hypothetical protein BDF19DRAFT_97707 [Syncephalis fuscata]
MMSPAASGRKLSAALVEGKLRPRLLNRVQSMLESESRPLEQEVERECELQMQLREFEDSLGVDPNIMASESNMRLPWLTENDGVDNTNAAMATNSSTFFRSKLNPEWDFFRGDPSPSPSSSCMSSPGLYPIPPGGAASLWSTSYSSTTGGNGSTGGPRRSKRKASCDRMDPYTSSFYKRRAGSPNISSGSPRISSGTGSPRTLFGNNLWLSGSLNSLPANSSLSLPSPLSTTAAQSSSTGSHGESWPLSGLSLGPPLQPLHSPSDPIMISRKDSLINIQETNMTFSKMSLDDESIEPSITANNGNTTATTAITQHNKHGENNES